MLPEDLAHPGRHHGRAAGRLPGAALRDHPRDREPAAGPRLPLTRPTSRTRSGPTSTRAPRRSSSCPPPWISDDGPYFAYRIRPPLYRQDSTSPPPSARSWRGSGRYMRWEARSRSSCTPSTPVGRHGSPCCSSWWTSCGRSPGCGSRRGARSPSTSSARRPGPAPTAARARTGRSRPPGPGLPAGARARDEGVPADDRDRAEIGSGRPEPGEDGRGPDPPARHDILPAPRRRP